MFYGHNVQLKLNNNKYKFLETAVGEILFSKLTSMVPVTIVANFVKELENCLHNILVRHIKCVYIHLMSVLRCINK